MRPFRWLAQFTFHPSDDEQTRGAKMVLVPPLFLLCIFCTASWLGSMRFRVAFFYVLPIAAVWNLVLLLYMLKTRRLPMHAMSTWILGMTVAAVCCDWAAHAGRNGLRAWVGVVLLMDVALYVGVSKRAQYAALSIVTIWLLASSIEDATRLGLYDIDHWSQDPNTEQRKEAWERRLSCSDPPCANSVVESATVFCMMMVVLFVDYAATRSFAHGMRTQTDRLFASVFLAERIAINLAHFDLDAARESLEDHHDALPEALSDSFAELLQNLSSYRPYLPDSCFATRDGTPEVPAEDLAMPRLVVQTEVSSVGSDDLSTTTRSKTGPQFTERSPQTEFHAQADHRRVRSVPGTHWRPSHALASPGSAGNMPVLRSVASEWTEPRSPLGASRSIEGSSSRSSPHSRKPSKECINEIKPVSPMHGMAAYIPQRKRVTLLACNRSGLLCELSPERVGDVSLFLAAEVALVWCAVADLKGTVDQLAADHITASFGAPRHLALHRAAAVRCAQSLKRRNEVHFRAIPHQLCSLPCTSAACSGTALCGDFGSTTTQRYMTVGSVAALLPAVERAAAAWHIPVLIDDCIREDCLDAWDCRLCAVVKFEKGGTESIIELSEVMREKSYSGGNREWMYELGALPPNPWERYNTIVRLWCDSQSDDAQDAATRLICQTEGSASSDSGETRAVVAQHLLLEFIRDRECPPTGPLCAVLPRVPAPG